MGLFTALQSEFTDEFAPATPFESTLVDMMISARWRSLRIQGLETSGIDDTVKTMPCPEELDASTRVSRALHNTDGGGEGKMRRYEAHYERLHSRAFNTLIKYRQLCGTIFSDRPSDDNQPSPPPPALEPQPKPAPETPRPAQLANWHKNRNKNRARRRREAATLKVRNEPTTPQNPAPEGHLASARTSQ